MKSITDKRKFLKTDYFLKKSKHRPVASPRGGLDNPLKKLCGGGLIFTHSEHSFPSLRTFISLIHSLIYSKFSGSLPHAGNSSILLRAHSKVKIINTNLRASMSDERLEHFIKVSIERDIANKIELDSLFELFETSGSWKLAL